MDSGVIVTSIGIGSAIFAGLLIFWFFRSFIKRRLGAEQSVQLATSSKRINGEEMRRHPRLEVSWPAAIEIRHGSIKARLKDISLGGAFVICRESISLNQQFRLYVETPDDEAFALNAEVVWSNMNVPEEKVIHRGMGIRFVQNTDAARKRLEKAISRHLPEAKIAAVWNPDHRYKSDLAEKKMQHLKTFSKDEIIIVNNVVSLAEELVSNHYKMSASEWLRPKYDVKTQVDLAPGEIVDGPFAQIVRYEGHRKNMPLGSGVFDYYKICLQDHAIHSTLKKIANMKLFPFCLYIITHELIHIVRFSKFLQSFDASPGEKLSEEKRVHENTHQILHPVQVSGMVAVLDFYNKWRQPLEGMRNS